MGSLYMLTWARVLHMAITTINRVAAYLWPVERNPAVFHQGTGHRADSRFVLSPAFLIGKSISNILLDVEC
ncbi:hypothetical protein B0H19DRAFT_1160785 [Mycena capillaripes]|nr:hypothetical protein B0H19DRAFT_1160785 [Mycena capillaripes]